MRLSKEEYKRAENCLKRYNYNRVTILNIRADIMSLGAVNYDGMPKAKYNISDSVSNSIIQLQENKYLQMALKECKAVEQALLLVNKDSKFIFEEIYIKNKTKWEIVSEGISESTYFRRKRDLVFAVNKELNKMATLKWGQV
jgi:DNA-directed RNA polymerase specialized sigma subunit